MKNPEQQEVTIAGKYTAFLDELHQEIITIRLEIEKLQKELEVEERMLSSLSPELRKKRELVIVTLEMKILSLQYEEKKVEFKILSLERFQDLKESFSLLRDPNTPSEQFVALYTEATNHLKNIFDGLLIDVDFSTGELTDPLMKAIQEQAEKMEITLKGLQRR